MTTVQGPRLSDHDFFTQAIDTNRPGLEGIPALVAQGDYAAARKAFATEARANLQPQRLLGTIRTDRRENQYTYAGESLQDAAERMLRLELISCGVPMQFEGTVDWFANPTYNQYKEWTWQLSRHWDWDVLAEVYQATGDERYAKGFVKLFQSWVQQALVPEDAPGNETKCWRTIETGIRMGRPWQRALHTFYQSPHFTDNVLVDWYKSVWEHGWRLRNFHRTHNWLIMEMNGLGQIAILYPQFKDAPEWKAYAIAKMIHELDTQVYADGMQYELSTNYHYVNIRNYQLLWNVMEAYDEPVPEEFRTVMEQMHTAEIKLMLPDGRLPDLNDGTWRQLSHMLEEAVRCYPERSDFRWVYTGGQEGRPPVVTSLALDYCGYYVMRTGWQNADIWALFDGGHFGYAHQHEDKLNLLLYAYGRLLLTEAGNYAYDSSPMRTYTLSTQGHNTIRVDDLDQNRRVGFARWRESEPSDAEVIEMLNTPNDAAWHTSPAYDIAEAQYDEGYGAQEDRTVTHQRRVIFIKQPPTELGMFFVVIDRLLSADEAPHSYQALWHMNTDEAETSAQNPLMVASQDVDQANLTIIMADSPNATVQIVTAQEQPIWQGWKSYGQVQGEYLPAPTADYRWQRTGNQRVVTLLYPTRADEECPVVQVIADTAVDATAIKLALRDGQVVDLDETTFTGA